ncbi:MAG: proline dehydrogenase family protein [Chloroflexota bacterium]|nr:proline dehydrogenase family protein [Chloroflexota bacterium]
MSLVLRRPLIALSHNRQLQDLIVGFPISRRMARRFVAGESLPEAIDVIKQVNARGLLATIDYLGENVFMEGESRVNADEYVRILQAIDDSNVNANVSIKLTAMGLAIDDGLCYENVRLIVQWAAELGNSVRIDMEDSPVTDRTLAIYRQLREDFDNVGTVIQSYLFRSQADVAQLTREGLANLRLCKGAYDEPPEVAFPRKGEVDRNLEVLIKAMLEGQSDYDGTYVAVASHDHAIINWTKAFAFHRGITPDRFEFQMLYGIRRDLQQALVDQGYRMRVYIPYGTAWYPYFMRRLAERPANLLFFLRALMGD